MNALGDRACHFTLGALLCAACSPALAADVGLAGVFPGKALLTINGGGARTVAVGQKTEEGVTVLAIDGETATLDVDGKKRILRVGQNVAAQASSGGPAKAVLSADGLGHFVTTGSINGGSVRFLVDTGASMISLGAGEARRIGEELGVRFVFHRCLVRAVAVSVAVRH